MSTAREIAVRGFLRGIVALPFLARAALVWITATPLKFCLWSCHSLRHLEAVAMAGIWRQSVVMNCGSLDEIFAWGRTLMKHYCVRPYLVMQEKE